MKKIAVVFVVFLALSAFVYLNLGKWLDVTEAAVKSDIVVCLGGGTIERVKRSVGLIEEGYARKKILFLLGESWYNQPYIKKMHPDLEVIVDERPRNTAQEVKFIKDYMRQKGHKSALIVTDPPHSGRVALLTRLIAVQGDADMTFHLIDSGVEWWEKEDYYKSERSRHAAMHESAGILYTLFVYGILDKIGVTIDR